MNSAEFRREFVTRKPLELADVLPGRVKPKDRPAKQSKQSPYRSKLEADFAAQLITWKQNGIIKDWRYESMRFKVGQTSRGVRWYKPDFVTIGNCGTITVYECKGYERMASMRYLEQAAERYPWFSWVIVKRGPDGLIDFRKITGGES